MNTYKNLSEMKLRKNNNKIIQNNNNTCHIRPCFYTYILLSVL